MRFWHENYIFSTKTKNQKNQRSANERLDKPQSFSLEFINYDIEVHTHEASVSWDTSFHVLICFRILRQGPFTSQLFHCLALGDSAVKNLLKKIKPKQRWWAGCNEFFRHEKRFRVVWYEKATGLRITDVSCCEKEAKQWTKALEELKVCDRINIKTTEITLKIML